MKTADDAISVIKELPPEERQKVADYLNREAETEFLEEDYSLEDIEKLDRIQEEAEKGINVSPRLKGEEANIYLRNSRNK